MVERLGRLDTCTVSDALEKLGLGGATLGIRPQWPCGRIAGRAVTMKLKPQGAETPKRHLGTEAIEAADPGDVIVAELSGRTDVPAWGGLLSLAAATKGIAGIVIDGACRDIDDSRAAGFPVFARAVVPITARGRIVQDSVNAEIEFAGVKVHPGDYVVADGSGTVIVPQERAAEVVAAGEAISAREEEMAAAVRAGRSIVEIMEGGGYESMLKPGKGD
ncbi:MAG TPA: RraA family protein [Alphaproteobacteria bacterium]